MEFDSTDYFTHIVEWKGWLVMAKIVVLGSGGFGTSLAVMLDKNGHDVTVWSAFSHEIDAIRRDGENRKLLPNIAVPPSIGLTTDISCIADAEIVLYAIPSQAVRIVAKQAAPHFNKDTIIVNVGKGLEDDTFKRLSEVLEEENPNNSIVVLSGPCHAEEVARGMPTTVVVGSKEPKKAEIIQDVLMNDMFRIYINNDVIGCEIGAALKNIIALAVGVTDGMQLGDNTKAAIMTRGIAEISRLGLALGGKAETFAGLTGIGDLIVTCTSMHSRNRRAGILIGQGAKTKDAIEKIGTVEGYTCTKVAYKLAKMIEVDMPIVNQLYAVLFDDREVAESLKSLMSRPRRHESESSWIC